MVPPVFRSYEVLSPYPLSCQCIAHFVTGNLGQIYSREGWRFHRQMVEKYGGAVKINGLLGVSDSRCTLYFKESSLFLLQCHQVYVSDPKAMYYMLVKDSSIYEETSWYTEYVMRMTKDQCILNCFLRRGNMLVFGPGLLSTTGAKLTL